MTRSRQSGFAMLLAVALIALAGAALALLAHGANDMRFQADRDAADARTRCLTASGLAWAQRRIDAGATPPAAEKALSADGLGIPGAELTVAIRAKGGAFEVLVATAHRFRGRTVRGKATSTIHPRP